MIVVLEADDFDDARAASRAMDEFGVRVVAVEVSDGRHYVIWGQSDGWVDEKAIERRYWELVESEDSYEHPTQKPTKKGKGKKS